MMNAKVRELLNQQINKEFYSAYLYLDFSNYYERVGLDGFANWYRVQAQEERDHAMLFYQYLQNNDQIVELEAIGKPDKVFTDNMGPLKAALEHEEYVTSLINDIYAGRTPGTYPISRTRTGTANRSSNSSSNKYRFSTALWLQPTRSWICFVRPSRS